MRNTDHLTFTRFVAAIVVVIFHFGMETEPFSWESIRFIFENGRIGVSYFFVLSGFVMMLAYGNKEKVRVAYFISRFARIFPLYWLSIALLIAVYELLGRNYFFKEIILQTVGLHSFFPKFSLIFNYPSWSITVELFFYSLFPLILSFTKGAGVKKIGVIAFVSFVITQALSVANVSNSFLSDNFVNFHPFMHLNEFFIGVVFGKLFISANSSPKHVTIKYLVTLAVIVILLKFKLPMVNYRNGFLAPLMGIFIYYLSFEQGVISKILRNRVLEFLGEISYGIYILQVPAFYFVNYLLKDNLSPAQLIYVYLLVLIAICSLTFILWESPIRLKFKQLIKRKKIT